MKSKINFSLLTLTFLLGGLIAFGQAAATQGTPQDISGTYEGMVKAPNMPEGKLSIDLKNEGGKITGKATHGDKIIPITDAKFEKGTLTLNFGPDHSFVGKFDGDKLVGEALAGTNKIPVELKKVTVSSPVAKETTPAADPVDLNGQWDAVADANGQPFPFVLTLKIEGENVTGTSSSQLGEATIKSGSWKNGKLALQMEGQNGVISVSATVIEGKLSGEYDYAGQLQGRWVAVKKN